MVMYLSSQDWMDLDVSEESLGPDDFVSADEHCMLDIVEAVNSSRSRSDFLRALNHLGATPSTSRLLSEAINRQTLPVLVRCSYRSWTALLGEPQDVKEHRSPTMSRPIHIWQHDCIDGPVTCIGHLIRRSSGVRQVVVVRVGLY